MGYKATREAAAGARGGSLFDFCTDLARTNNGVGSVIPMRDPRLTAVSVGVALAGVGLLWLLRNRARKKWKERADPEAEVEGLESVVADINFGGGTHHKDAGNTASPTRIYDARSDPGRFTVHESSFQLILAPEAAVMCEELDLYDADVCVDQFFPLVEDIVLRHCPGATRAIAFDHILRNPKRLASEAAAIDAAQSALSLQKV